MGLCPDCHRVKHIGLAGIQRKGDEALKHLAQVNGWDVATSEQYVEAQFEVWQRRSRFQWELDLSWLERHGVRVKPKKDETAGRPRKTDAPREAADPSMEMLYEHTGR